MGQENFNDLLKQHASEFKLTPSEGAFESMMKKREAEKKNSYRRGWLFFAAAAVFVAATVWLWPVSQQEGPSRLAEAAGSQGTTTPANELKENAVSVITKEKEDAPVNAKHDMPATEQQSASVTNNTPSSSNKPSQPSTSIAQQSLTAPQTAVAEDKPVSVRRTKSVASVNDQIENKPTAKPSASNIEVASVQPKQKAPSSTGKTTSPKQPAIASANATKNNINVPENIKTTTGADQKNPDASVATTTSDKDIKPASASTIKPALTPVKEEAPANSTVAGSNETTNSNINGIAQLPSVPDSVSQTPPVVGGISPKSAGIHKWAVNLYHHQYFINQNKNTARESSVIWPDHIPNEQAKSAFASGISAEYIANNRFTFSIGINYGKVNFEKLRFTTIDTTNVKNELNPITPSTNNGSEKVYQKNITDRQFTFFEMPVMTGLLMGAGKFKFHVQAGVAYQYLQSTSTYVFIRDSSIVETVEKNDIGSGRLNRHNIVVMSSATVNYEAGKHLWIYAGPSVRFNLLSHYEEDYAVRPAAAHYGVQGGIKILF